MKCKIYACSNISGLKATLIDFLDTSCTCNLVDYELFCEPPCILLDILFLNCRRNILAIYLGLKTVMNPHGGLKVNERGSEKVVFEGLLVFQGCPSVAQ